MTEPSDGLVVPGLTEPDPPPARPPLPAVFFSLLALTGSFAVLLQVDLPILWFLRSHNLSAFQPLGDMGEKLGNGGTLVAISVLIMLTGVYLKRQSLTRLGRDSLLAHGVVALVVNGLKHLIGRPRPRLTHSGGWQWWPSWDAGLDSFPSGHTSATVAVVTVLSRAVPQWRWLFFGVAAWVAASRIWRGSHFPSDVISAMVMGFMVGSIFNRPLRWWGRSCGHAIVAIAPMTLFFTGLFWVPMHRIVDPTTDGILFASGAVLVAVSVVLRWTASQTSVISGDPARTTTADCLLTLGLGIVTAAPVLMILTGLVCLARWSRSATFEGGSVAEQPSKAYASLHALGAAVLVVAIQTAKGVVPLQ
ncbi:MAG TPA: phosphatase PAP2 family protein [Nitrospira sp.]|nr:phosphatase PAP2 family protein [Nitrospira sp.]